MSNDLHTQNTPTAPEEPPHIARLLDVLGGAYVGVGIVRRMLTLGQIDTELLDYGLADIENKVLRAYGYITDDLGEVA